MAAVLRQKQSSSSSFPCSSPPSSSSLRLHMTTMSTKFLANFLLISSIHFLCISAFIIPHGGQIDHDLLIYNPADSEYKGYQADDSLKLHGTDLLVLHSQQKHVRKLGDCVEVSDRNATLLKSISRTSDSLVELDPNEQHFNVHYCANAPSGGQQECGENSVCGTIYRWKKAMVRVETPAALSAAVGDDLPDIFLQEQVLVPSGCSCLINAANTKFARMPIIIES